jgi:hypothetical protein
MQKPLHLLGEAIAWFQPLQSASNLERRSGGEMV